MLSRQRQDLRGSAPLTQPLSAGCRRGVPVPVDGRSGARAGRGRSRLRAAQPARPRPGRGVLRRLPRDRTGSGAGPGLMGVSMASRTSVTGDLRELERALEQWQEPGAANLCELLERMVGDGIGAGSERTMQLERLKQAVYRLRIGSAPSRTLVLKRHPPAVAQADRLLVERWLPALGLGDGCPRLLAAAAERAGRWVWHVYEDLGDESLAVQRLPWRLEAAVDFIAELHTRAANHPILAEVRWRARDHGVYFFTANLRDSIATLEALAIPPRDVPHEFARARERLLHRLYSLREEAPRRVQAMEEAGGPE